MDFVTHSVPESTHIALNLARQNGHEIILTTGRPPALFYGIDKELGFHNFIAANGRVVVYHDDIIYESPIPEDKIEILVKIARENGIDIAYESMDDYILETQVDDLYRKFSDHFNLHYPKLQPGYYKNRSIYQICWFYDRPDFKKFEKYVPGLSFEFSSPYGIDVNTSGGFKEVGIKVFMEKLHLTQDDIIAIGDGFNDISMLQFVDNSVAMGNAHEDVKKAAKYVTDDILENGLYKAFEHLGLLKTE